MSKVINLQLTIQLDDNDKVASTYYIGGSVGMHLAGVYDNENPTVQDLANRFIRKERVEELTVAEIEEKLGYKVKVVK